MLPIAWLSNLRGRFLAKRGGKLGGGRKTRRKGLSWATVAVERLEERVLLVAPVAMGSSESTHFNAMLMGSVSASDSDGDSLMASVSVDPLHGSVMLNADGSYYYTPYGNFVGTDAFDFHVNDGSAFSNVATVTISLMNTNTTPSQCLSAANRQ